LLPSLLTVTLHAPASALGLIEGISDAAAGVARLAGGALSDDPGRRRRVAVGGYTTAAVLPAAIGAAAAPWQAGILRAGAWASRGLRVPARNALLADIVPPAAYGRAYGFERAMDNLGAIGGPLLAIALVALVGIRAAIALSVIPGLLAALAIIYAIRHMTAARQRTSQPIRLRIRPVLHGRPGRLMIGATAFELGNVRDVPAQRRPPQSEAAAQQHVAGGFSGGRHARSGPDGPVRESPRTWGPVLG
jgi:MFS family permease